MSIDCLLEIVPIAILAPILLKIVYFSVLVKPDILIDLLDGFGKVINSILFLKSLIPNGVWLILCTKMSSPSSEVTSKIPLPGSKSTVPINVPAA